MTEEDVVVASEAGGAGRDRARGSSYEVDLVDSDPEAYDRFYSVIANPQLWFTQHYLWDLSNAPDIRAEEKGPGSTATRSSTTTSPRRSSARSRAATEPLVMFHDYHLYTAPGMVRAARPEAFLHHFVHIPWPQPDAWRILPRGLARGDLRRPARQRHHRLPHHRLRARTSSTAAASCSARGRLPQRGRPPRGPRDLGPRLPARDRRRPAAPGRRHRRGRGVRARAARAAAAST